MVSVRSSELESTSTVSVRSVFAGVGWLEDARGEGADMFGSSVFWNRAMRCSISCEVEFVVMVNEAMSTASVAVPLVTKRGLGHGVTSDK